MGATQGTFCLFACAPGKSILDSLGGIIVRFTQRLKVASAMDVPASAATSSKMAAAFTKRQECNSIVYCHFLTT